MTCRLYIGLLALVTVIAGISACGPAFEKPKGMYLAAIKIEGTKAIPVDEIAPGLAIDRQRRDKSTNRVGRQVDTYQLTVDVERVRAAYLKLGFFDATVAARIDTQGMMQTVVFVVHEGPRSKTKVEITGLPSEIPLEDARDLVKVDDGEPFDYAIYDAAKEPIQKLVENAGYAQVQIEAVVLADRANHMATVRFTIAPGSRSTFGEISIAGAGSLTEAIRGRLTFKAGDVYTQSALAATQTSLYNLNRFATVRIEPDLTKGNVVPVKVTVERSLPGEFRIGFGAGRDSLASEIRGRLGVSYWFDALPLWSFAFDFKPAAAYTEGTWEPKLRAVATASRNDFFLTDLTAQIETSYDYLRYEAYLAKGPRLRLSLEKKKLLELPWFQARVGWVIERQDFTEIQVAEPAAQEINLTNPDGSAQTQRRGAYEASLIADLRDNPLDAHKGLYVSMRAVLGSGAALGDQKYQQLIPDLRGYIPLPHGIVFAARARYSLLYGDVPVTERFYGGGVASQRGFGERGMSPRAPTPPDAMGSLSGNTVAIGGTAMLEDGVELRIPLSKHIPGTEVEFPLGMTLFLDAGDSVLHHGDLDVFNQNIATGVAFYLKIFSFKVGLDAGERITRRQDYSGNALWGVWENMAIHLVVGDAY
ncbi:MAG TPA: POTRA domain-containing protein [Kofleriaceae bacterium]